MNVPAETTDRNESIATDLEDFVAYEDDDALVICERSNPNAWIRSTVTEPLDQVARRERAERDVPLR